MKNASIYYSIGALLYCPANHPAIADSVITEKLGRDYSLALCLEDTIGDSHVAEAEESLLRSLARMEKARQSAEFYIPKLFIRVRMPAQIEHLLQRLGSAREMVCGFILPKFDLQNAPAYLHAMAEANHTYNRRFYGMPIMESPSIVDLRTRIDVLYRLKDQLDQIEASILNIRVGGNDLCHLFGFRRHHSETIHQIRPVADIFADIITVFAQNYVVSGPVWEYYSGAGWESGFIQELKEDRLCGFIGKTAIHPRQIPLIREAYAVTREEYEDAKAILGWDESCANYVSGNTRKERMNEYKTHTNWARKILFLAEAYGIL